MYFFSLVAISKAKLKYSSSFETINSGFKTKPNRRINENLGRASKAAGIAVKKTSKQPIVESDEMVKRFQKLAGIL